MIRRPPGWHKCRSRWIVSRWGRWYWLHYFSAKKCGQLCGRACLPPMAGWSDVQRALQEAWKVKRIDAAAVTATHAVTAVNAGSWGKKLPNVVERLTCIRYDDGTPRTPGYVRIECRAGGWIVQYVEPDGCVQLKAEASTPDELYPLLEGLLAAPEVPWQPAPWLKPKKSPKAK